MKTFVIFVANLINRFLFILPASVRALLGWVLGVLWFDVFRIRRRVILENIGRVFPQISRREHIRLGRRSMIYFCRAIVDYCKLKFLTKELIHQQFEIRGLEHLQKAQSKGRGVCLLTLHLGNGDLSIAALSVLGYPMALLSKEFKLGGLNEWWFEMRKKAGTQFIPPRNSSYAVLKALKKGECVVFVMDQFMGPPIGARTTFFGIETGTAMGLAVMAGRSGAPVIPAFTYTEAGKKNVIEFCPEIPFAGDPQSAEVITRQTQIYNHELEKIILKYPEQWMWLHRRWKKFVVNP